MWERFASIFTIIDPKATGADRPRDLGPELMSRGAPSVRVRTSYAFGFAARRAPVCAMHTDARARTTSRVARLHKRVNATRD